METSQYGFNKVAVDRNEQDYRENRLLGSNIRLIVPEMHTASLVSTNSKPSLEIKVTYSEGSDSAMVNNDRSVKKVRRGMIHPYHHTPKVIVSKEESES